MKIMRKISVVVLVFYYTTGVILETFSRKFFVSRIKSSIHMLCYRIRIYTFYNQLNAKQYQGSQLLHVILQHRVATFIRSTRAPFLQ